MSSRSTRLLQDLGAEQYGAALQEHCDLLRRAFERHDGYEVNFEGDSFFIAFASAPAAVAAAEDARQALAAHAWPDDREFRVRIGIHTGRPLLAPPKYVGMDVHRAARIAASGHGGQVLVSAATAEALEPQAFDLDDLGEHRFKDLGAPERVFQLGREPFPPIRSLYRTSLPIPTTAFLGRERELSEVVSLLTRSDVRLLTLTGPGGTGKTRLALQAAAEASEYFPDGAYWVPLASLRDPELVLPAVAQALEVKGEQGTELVERLSAWLAGKRALVALDNAEQLLPGFVAELARLVVATNSVCFLITSRERLQVRDEHVYPVGMLDEETGIQLFLERAAAAGVPLERTDSLRMLCTNLDQLPLALELAAARAVLFSPQQLLDRLSQRLDLLRAGRDADPRQQTLRATIAWSYELLDEEEQELFRSFPIFAGGCTYEAAEEVASARPDTLQSLIDKNLIHRRDADSGVRYWMLETIRSFAGEHLQTSGQAASVPLAHAEWFTALAERGAREFFGTEQVDWLGRLEREHDNLRAALAWTHGATRVELALRLTTALRTFWFMHGHIDEGRRWFELALQTSGASADLRARALGGACVFAAKQGDLGQAREFASEGLALYRKLGDRRGTAMLLRDSGAAAALAGDHHAARTFYEEGAELFRDLGERALLASMIANLGDLASRQGDLALAAERTREGLAIQRELGEMYGVAISLHNLGFIALRGGRDKDARDTLEESMLLAHDLGYTDSLASSFEGLAAVAVALRDWDTAARLLGRAEATRESSAIALDSAEQAIHEQTLAALAAARSASQIGDGLSAGRALTDKDAISLARALPAAGA